MTEIAVVSTSYLPSDRPWLIGEASGIQAPTISVEDGTIDFSLFTASTHYPNLFIPSGIVVAKTTGGRIGPYAGNVSEGQTVTITGTPTGGTFTLTFDGETTAAIAYNAAASAVATALGNLSNLDAADVAVTGGPGPGAAYVVTFGGARAGKDVPAMTATGSFTGGTTPAIAVTTSTAGGSTASNGLQTPVGFLYNATRVPTTDLTRKVQVAYVDAFARIWVSRLPTNHGLDAAAQAALNLIKFRP